MPARTRNTHTPRVREGEEIWETTTPGKVWILVTDDRGKEKSIKVGGASGQRLRVKSLDREINQDAILGDESDPFTNGLLRRIDADQQLDPATQSDQVLDTEQLMEIFALTGAEFNDAVSKLNELNTRRLAEMAEAVDATASQIAFLRETVATNFRQEGDTATWRELNAGPQGAPGTVVV